MDTNNNQELIVVQQPEIVLEGRMIPVEEMRLWYLDFVKFSKSILKEGLDFGVIPGCKKPSLYKPGAEKLMVAYGMSIDVYCTKEIIDFDRDFLCFTYKAIVKKNDRSWQCEGSCNSLEKKYQLKNWNEETKSYDYLPNPNPFEIMNTLQKMAQKRAMVGAVLIATGASEFFTQDLEGMTLEPNNDYKEVKSALPKWLPGKFDECLTIEATRNERLNILQEKKKGFEKWAKDKKYNYDEKELESLYLPYIDKIRGVEELDEVLDKILD